MQENYPTKERWREERQEDYPKFAAHVAGVG